MHRRGHDADDQQQTEAFLDGRIDKVPSSMRAAKPDKAAEEQALTALLTSLT